MYQYMGRNIIYPVISHFTYIRSVYLWEIYTYMMESGITNGSIERTYTTDKDSTLNIVTTTIVGQ